jgi:hypothetical protein
MFHICAGLWDVTENLKTFCILKHTKHGRVWETKRFCILDLDKGLEMHSLSFLDSCVGVGGGGSSNKDP